MKYIEMLKAFKIYWPQILICVPMIISIINAATNHWSNQKGVVKVLTFITEILSFLASKDVQGALKIPFLSKKPSNTLPSDTEKGGKIASIALPFLLLCNVTVDSGCATLRSKITVAHEAVAISANIGATALHAQCTSKATDCKKAGDTTCIEWQKCDAARKQFEVIIFAIEDNLKALNRLVQENKIEESK
jgi:hypothetical protein